MAFGIYIHIPYCVQRCPYCDFATYEQSQIPPTDKYVQLVRQEIQRNVQRVLPQKIDTLFLGGGTPSLLEASSILTIFDELRKQGFTFSSTCEITIEINPATITPKKIKDYMRIGINRFSVGSQTFSDRLLKKIGRKHNLQDTIDTVDMLVEQNANYSLDLLFALPTQTMKDLEHDLETILGYRPPHVSCYYLTIPESNPLSLGRPLEDDQIVMFDKIESSLLSAGYERYEISNYCLPTNESRHNMLYWTDEDYWGIGLSAHSYIKSSTWGTRFWNPKTYREYQDFSEGKISFPAQNREVLQLHEALTDFCHTSLRISLGLTRFALQNKFGEFLPADLFKRLDSLVGNGLLDHIDNRYFLTPRGRLVSNQVFESLTFLEQDLVHSPVGLC